MTIGQTADGHRNQIGALPTQGHTQTAWNPTKRSHFVTAVFFEDLCRHASRELRLDDTETMGQEEGFELDGVTMEVLHEELHQSLLVMAELGGVTAEDAATVYQKLLALQLLTWHQPGIRFGYQEERASVVLMLGVPMREDMNGPWLARALRAMAAQVAQWRATLLAGCFSWDPAGAEGGASARHPLMA